MRPFESWVTQYHENILSFSKFDMSEYSEKPRFFRSFNMNNSEKHRLSFEDIFWGTLDTYTKKMNPSSAVLGGGGVHGKVCWLIALYSWECAPPPNIHDCV